MPRKPQHERSAETVAKLVEATIDLLHDRGLARLSTQDIAEWAGVSRGALTHHFSSRDALIAEAVSQQLRGCTAALHERALAVRRTGGSTDELVDYLWHMMSDRLFYVTMEYLPEARHNPAFRTCILPVVVEFHQGLNAVWAELADVSGVSPARVPILMNATMCMIRGMIAQTTVKNDPAYFTALLDFWKAQVRREFDAAGSQVHA